MAWTKIGGAGSHRHNPSGIPLPKIFPLSNRPMGELSKMLPTLGVPRQIRQSERQFTHAAGFKEVRFVFPQQVQNIRLARRDNGFGQRHILQDLHRAAILIRGGLDRDVGE